MSSEMATEENLTTTRYENYTSVYDMPLFFYTFFKPENDYLTIYTCIILTIESPFFCLAIYTIFFLTISGQEAPVFVINLLISDLIQSVSFVLCLFKISHLAEYVFVVSFLASLYFMTCVAIERYLLIAHPIWYRHRHPVKCLVCTSLTGWLLSGILFFIFHWWWVQLLFIIPLFYYLVIVFCFVGACRALSQSQSITSLKRQLVIATLLFVLLSYTFTILPLVITSFLEYYYYYYYYFDSMLFRYTRWTAMGFYMLNPIVDCLLYVFMRTDAGDAFRTPHCCSRRREIQSETQLTNLTGVHSHHV